MRMLVHLPEMQQARESNALVTLMDLAPTLMDLAGASYDPGDLDAKSFADLLKGEEQSPHEVQQSELMNTIMLFDGRYKWIRSFNDSSELYDLQADPDELHNCIAEHPEVIQRLRKYTFRA